MVTQQQIQQFAEYCEQHLDFSIGDPPGYLSVPVCAFDAVFSPRLKYKTVTYILYRFCHEYDIKLLTDRITTSRMLKLLANCTPQQLADRFGAHYRTCGRNSILKFEAFIGVLNVMKKHKIETCADIHRMAGNTTFEKDFLKVQGQGRAVLNYFYILSRMEDYVKVDIHICEFVNMALPGCNLSTNDIETLIKETSKVMVQGAHKGMTLRHLDYIIWKYKK